MQDAFPANPPPEDKAGSTQTLLPLKVYFWCIAVSMPVEGMCEKSQAPYLLIGTPSRGDR